MVRRKPKGLDRPSATGDRENRDFAAALVPHSQTKPHIQRMPPAYAERLAAALADRYQLERPLGYGGMATVHLAQDLKHRRRVAVKVVRPELASPLGAKRFLREIEIAAALNHPHILAVRHSGEAAGVLYYVMPYVEGES